MDGPVSAVIPVPVVAPVSARMTVRAAVIDAPGSGPRIDIVELGARTTGTTLLEVLAAPLNPLDIAIASGAFHSVRHDAPYVPGSECVGVVVESDVHATGALVYAECHASPSTQGPLATHVLVPDDSVLALPDEVDLDPVLAAAVGNAGIAAYLPLIERAGLCRGESVLVLGATGAVGRLAVQIARLNGAGHVVGVARDHAALDQLLDLGADAIVDLRAGESVEDLAARLLGAGGPADVVLDGVYGAPLEAALVACGAEARIVNIGNPAGANASIPAGLLRGKQLTLSGFAGLHVPFQEKVAALTWLWTALASGDLRLDVTTFPLEDLQAAWHAQTTSLHGKCVVLPGAGHTDHPQRPTDGSEHR